MWEEILPDETRRMTRPTPKQASLLIVAGLDPSGGAGLLADAQVIQQNGFHAAGVVTALTEQDSVQCAWMHPVSAELISNQIARLIDDFEICGVKIGMLATTEIAHAVARTLRRLVDDGVPIVVDPILRATRGVPLLEGTPLHALGPLLEIATLVTPNLDELEALSGRRATNPDEMRDNARRLRSTAHGLRAVLAKGGHLPGDPIDVLVDDEGDLSFKAARVEGPSPHGTGCALSSEIACRLANGTPLREAVLGATERVRVRIAEARTVGRGRPFLG
jgi:hydroxymethylpyrimidine kinase/phosphomethylpyrimidine kinase